MKQPDLVFSLESLYDRKPFLSSYFRKVLFFSNKSKKFRVCYKPTKLMSKQESKRESSLTNHRPQGYFNRLWSNE